MAGQLALSAAYLSRMGSQTTATAALEEQLAAACARGRAAFPGIAVADELFSGHLGSIVGPDAEARHWAGGEAAIGDLYLACACLNQVPGAVDLFISRYGSTIESGVSRLVRGADGGELRQVVLNDLLVGADDAGPRLARYRGTGPLDRWIGVAAKRRALMWMRAKGVEHRAHRRMAADPLLDGSAHPELAYLKEKYRREFERALAAAVERLSERDRFILRMYLVDGMATEKIGRMYGVVQSTVSRWLIAARADLREHVMLTLKEGLGASDEEIGSLAALVASQLDVSLPRLLGGVG